MDFKQVESGRIRCAVRLQDSTEPVIHTDFGYNVVEQDRGQRYCPDDLRSAMCPSQNPTNSSLSTSERSLDSSLWLWLRPIRSVDQLVGLRPRPARTHQ